MNSSEISLVNFVSVNRLGHKKELQEFRREAKSFSLVIEKMDSDFRELKKIVWEVLEYVKDNLI